MCKLRHVSCSLSVRQWDLKPERHISYVFKWTNFVWITFLRLDRSLKHIENMAHLKYTFQTKNVDVIRLGCLISNLYYCLIMISVKRYDFSFLDTKKKIVFFSKASFWLVYIISFRLISVPISTSADVKIV